MQCHDPKKLFLYIKSVMIRGEYKMMLIDYINQKWYCEINS